jgi:uncharacterized protein (DUF1501 family)
MLGLATDTLGTRLAFADGSYTGDTLVVLSLRGGFDGLSAVVPAGDSDYYAWRPTIAVPKASLLPIDTMWGLHPALAPLYPLWQAGQLGAVTAVGNPDPTRSHFEATNEMERAAPGSTLRTGWIDRALGLRSAGTVFQATQVGYASPSGQFAGPFNELSLGRLDDFGLDAAGSTTEANRWSRALKSLYASAPAPIAAPANAALAALSTVQQLRATDYQPANGASYDDSSELAKALRDVARMIKGNVGLQVAAVDFGDWDMHEGLGAAGGGWMNDHLTELANALLAFTQDLGTAMDKVTVITLSEFGRRLEENGSGGVDHGHGNQVLLLGGGVNGGQVHGTWPGLKEADLDDGDLAKTTDYRQVLAEVLSKRCGQTGMSTVFPGLPSGVLGVVKQG